MLKVAEKQMDSDSFATLFFDHALDFKPGQFIMAWLPGVDEKPFTVSYHSKNRFGITIEAKGIFSGKAIQMAKGDLMGIRGPFGNGFDIKGYDHIAVVAGGCGMAPLAPLLEKTDPATRVTLIHGARSKKQLLFPDRFSQNRPSMGKAICTDDGTKGHQGVVTDILRQEIEAGSRFDMVYTCGPEIMMYHVVRLCRRHQIPCQVSLERYMRCGFGVCGACVCNRQVVCKDGPVFNDQQLTQMSDFNTRALLKNGEAVELSRYYSWRNKQII